MASITRGTSLTAVLAFASVLGGSDVAAWAFDASAHSDGHTVSEKTAIQPDAAPAGILVEVFLSPDHRADIQAIKRDFEALSVTRLRTQVFRLGHPPRNIAIGRDVPVPVAQLAIRLAVAYNGGVEFLLPQYRFFPKHVAIGTSAFDEASQIPVSPEGLEQLADPALTTEAFHKRYRTLTGEDARRPTYLDE